VFKASAFGLQVIHMRATLLLTLSLTAVGAFAQTRSSFLGVDAITGITVTPSNGGLTFLVQLDADPYFTYNGHDYHITDLIGFYNLSDDDDLTVTNSAFTGNFGPWATDNSNANTGGIAGRRSNPNDGITVGNSETFTYSALSVANVERLGFHVRLDELFPGTEGNTGNITTVPEPVSMVGLLVGLGGLAARRRRNK
jgi:hypothetical protein